MGKTNPWVVALAVVGGIAVLFWLFNQSTSLEGTQSDNTPRPLLDQSDTRGIDEDTRYSLSFTLGQPARLSFSVQVQQGPRIDVVLVDAENYVRIEHGDSHEYLSDCTDFDTAQTSRTCVLGAGKYYLVLDNTDELGTGPPFDGRNNYALVNYHVQAWSI